MDDLDESLPSRSTFAYTEQTHRSYSGSRGFGASHAVIDEEDEYLYYDRRSFDETHRDSADLDRSMAPSPPPPPPPPPPPVSDLPHDDMDEAPVSTRTTTSFTLTARSNGSHSMEGGGGSTPKQRSGPFPFLKKNSRKEPSAVYKKPASPESTQKNPSTPFQSEPRTNKARRHHPSPATATTATISSTSTSALVRSTNDGDILLTGDDYWGLDGSIAQDLQAIRSSRPVDYMEESTLSLASTVSIGLNDWRRAKPDNDEDIRDFAALEQRVADPPVVSASRPQRPSTQQRSFQRDEDEERDVDNDSQRSSVEINENSRQSRASSSHSSWGPATQPRGLSKTSSMPPTSSRAEPISSLKAATAQRRSIRDSSPTLTQGSRTSVAASTSSRLSSGQSVEEGRLIRPSSTMRARGASPGPPSARKAPGSNSKSRLSQTAKSGSAHAPSADAQLLLDEKAKELEAEIETYRQENAQLKRLRKQQESGILELAQKREEVLKFCEEERARTMEWCEEQRTAAERDKRAAAKQARETRQKAASGTLPIRKEKAEVEALQANYDKLKAAHEAATKKWKLTENRLYSVIKDHSAHIDRLDQQVLTLEEQKITLLDFIAQNGLRLPKTIRAKVLAGPESASQKGAEKGKLGQTFSQSPRLSDRGYVEEVDVEEVIGLTTQAERSSARSEEPLSQPVGTPSSRVKGAGSLSISHAEDWAVRTAAGSLNSTGGGRPSSASSSSSATKLHQTTGKALGSVNNVSMSWARSSKSSARYSTSSFEAEDLGGEAEGHAEGANYEDGGFGMEFTGSEMDSTRQTLRQTWHPTETGNHANSSNNSNGNNLGGTAVPRSTTETNRSTGIALSASSGQKSSPAVPASTSTPTPASAAVDASGRTEETLPDGSKRVHYRNGTIKTVDPQGRTTVVFTNGDTKRTDPLTGTVVYYYFQANTAHTTFPDGLEVYEFPNKQMERHYPDGRKEVIFPDKTRKIIETDGTQESHFPDGVVLREYSDGRKEVLSTGR